MTPTVQVCLVSDQAAANLLPALDPALKPREVVLLVSGKMKPRADALEAVLREAGVGTSRVDLADEHDYALLEAALLEVASERDGQSIALNVTGGTKLMALAAQAVAVAANWAVFYVDVDTDEVIWLAPAPHRQALGQQLRLRHYLGGYGFSLDEGIERPQREPRHDDLLRTLVTQVGSLEQPLAQLNWLAQQAEDRRSLQVTLSEQQADSRALDALLRNFQDAGALAVKDTTTLIFTSEADRDFVKGGWLERHVFQSVDALSRELGLRDKAANLVVRDASGVKNELDVAFLARNRLFVIECKTARMDRPEAPKANDTLFKLAEICRRVGGLGTRGLLVSYRGLRDEEKRLAAALRIELATGGELARLKEKIKNWVGR
ncbi:MAG TPA: DUF1887 family CARF protein [Candidatus Macondimonas sp.]|nr:DUF1887 family CARF protein [Candidatus Macondimonas sp.]